MATPTPIVRAFQPGDAMAVFRLMNKYARSEMLRYGVMTHYHLAAQIAIAEFSLVGYVGAKPVAVFGAWPTSMVSQKAELWMIATEHINECAFLFIRYARIELEKLKSKFASICCHVNEELNNRDKWMRLLGFRSRGVVVVDGVRYVEYKLEKK